MRKLIVELPDEIHRELKKNAAINNKTLKEIITELIQEYIHSREKAVLAEKETGICGSWDDERTPDEIIRDIKTHRKWLKRHEELNG